MSQPLDLRDLDAEWRESAACRGLVDAYTVFFPVDGNDLEARRICATCEVQPECDAYAGEIRADFGVWGGILREQGFRRNARGCKTCGGPLGTSGLIRGKRRYCTLDCLRADETRADL